MAKAVITLTDNAVSKVKELLEKRPGSLGIKIGVKEGGCSGYKYTFEYADEKKAYDEVVQEKGVTILIEPRAIIHLIGTELDYVEDKFKSGFVFNNPNEKASCGCGESFST